MDLGWFLFDTSRSIEGLAVMADAKERILKTRGDDPQTVPFALNRYGRGLLQVGRLEEGNEVLAQATRMLRKYRPGSGYLATALDLQANGLTDLGRYQEARALLDEAAQIHAGVHDEPVYVNDNLAARSRLLLATGKPAEAAKALEAFFIKDPAPGTISLTWVHGSLGRADAALAMQKPEPAVDLASRVRTAVERNPSRVYFKNYEAQAALAEGKALLLMRRTSEALPLLERAVTLGSELYDPTRSPILAGSQLALASCLFDLGRRDPARALLASAKAIQATHQELGEQFKKPLRELSQRQ
jgi:tetratricopeptide (TPR) repeat protein